MSSAYDTEMLKEMILDTIIGVMNSDNPMARLEAARRLQEIVQEQRVTDTDEN